ncbi:MAG: hypothetical protein KCHDKBKB_00620 [Elusimicrobia bacterium]|nr:hypothetical protein [Elusimicrobiota bacterium]
MDKLIKQLAQIQKTLNAPKSRRNKFGNYNYRNCEDILDAVKPLVGDLVIKLEDEVVLIGERYYIKATATLTDGTNNVSSSAFARESLDKKGMDDSQITGAASSYARKYALNGLFAIDDTKDADSDENKEGSHTTPAPQAPQTTQPVQPKQTTNSLATFTSWSEKINKLNTKEELLKIEELIKVATDLKPAEKFMLRKQIETKSKELIKPSVSTPVDVPEDEGMNNPGDPEYVAVEDLPF